MNAAICLLLYGAALAWLSSPLLDRVTRNGLSPRLSVAVWLCAIAMAFGVWVVTGIGLMLDAVAYGAHTGPVEYCLRIVHELNHVGVLGPVALAVMGVAAFTTSVVVARRIMLTLRRFWTNSRDHAHDARVLGTTSRGPDVVVVPAHHPAAYCVAGRPHAIVLTTGAIDTLEESELAAVLAHEQAHLIGSSPTTHDGVALARVGHAASSVVRQGRWLRRSARGDVCR